jgi:hypothetical protein
MMYRKQFQISQPSAPGLWGELCIQMHGWIQQDSCHSDRFILSTYCSAYDSSDIAYWNFVSILYYYYIFCILTKQKLIHRNRPDWPPYCLVWALEHSHSAFRPSTSSDKLSSLTIWSMISRERCHVASAKCILVTGSLQECLRGGGM